MKSRKKQVRCFFSQKRGCFLGILNVENSFPAKIFDRDAYQRYARTLQSFAGRFANNVALRDQLKELVLLFMLRS